ncbi:MAG: DUF927 domain-containing protein [Gemmataceae bacterium]|nr:DUF927 domain-containing protein [Gemmataceae bacterium]
MVDDCPVEGKGQHVPACDEWHVPTIADPFATEGGTANDPINTTGSGIAIPVAQVQPALPESGTDALAAEMVEAIEAGWQPTTMEKHLKKLATVLVNVKAGKVATDAWLGKLNARLKALKLTALAKKAWETLLKDAAATADFMKGGAVAETVPLAQAIAVLPGAPVPEGVVVPAGWRLTQDGTWQARAGQDVRVLPTPLLVTRRLLNAQDRTERVELAWMRDGLWASFVVGREVIASKGEIVALARHGLPVTSETAALTVAYLAETEAANMAALPLTQVRRQLGWTGDAMTSFLWGRQLLEAEGMGVGQHEVRFQGDDAGDEQMADGYKAKGGFDVWRAAVTPALAHPRVRLALLASLATPLLGILRPEGAHNFTVDFCGETSRGKTSTLRLAASAWGSPDERSVDGAAAITTWNSTRVGSERVATLCNGLPVIRDDTKLARDKRDIAQMLYDIAAGRGRERGTIKGLDRQTTFTTIMLTSGEARAVSYSTDGGARGRVVTLWGPPFGPPNAASAAMVEALNSAILAHHGHAGQRFVQHLLDGRAKWEGWREQYRSIRAGYVARAAGNAVLGRLSDALAVITLTGILATESLGMAALAATPVDELWTVLASESADADRATLALAHALDWAAANQALFHGIGHHEGQTRSARGESPGGGWAGRWDTDGAMSPFLVGFIPARLKKVLEEAGHEYDAVVSTWRDRGWLKVDASDRARLHHQTMLDGQKPRLIAVLRSAAVAVGFVPDQPLDRLSRAHAAAREFRDAAGRLSGQVGDIPQLQAAVAAVQQWEHHAHAAQFGGTGTGGTPPAQPAQVAAAEGATPPALPVAAAGGAAPAPLQPAPVAQEGGGTAGPPVAT